MSRPWKVALGAGSFQRVESLEVQSVNLWIAATIDELCQQAVVRCHEHMAVALSHEYFAFGADARIDDRQVYGTAPETTGRIG